MKSLDDYDQEIQEVIKKYAFKHNITVDEALKHKFIEDYISWKIESRKEKLKR